MVLIVGAGLAATLLRSRSSAAPTPANDAAPNHEPSPSFTTLITADAAAARCSRPAPPLVLLDASFDLGDADAGERACAAGHLPGAHLRRTSTATCAARRPAATAAIRCPSARAFAARSAAWASRPARQVVVLRPPGRHVRGARSGGCCAGSATARWRCSTAASPAWTAAGGALVDRRRARRAAAPPYPERAPALPTHRRRRAAAPARPRCALIDARAGERFRGEVEPLDAVAGHIPGALNRFFKDNLGADGRFKPADAAARRVRGAARRRAAPARSCTSAARASPPATTCWRWSTPGWPARLLYPGSWSEWSADPARPVARG